MIATDKTYLISLLNQKEKHHKNTKKLQKQYTNKKIINQITLIETINTIHKQTDKNTTYKIYQYIKNNYHIYNTETLTDNSIYYLLKYPKISLTDAITIQTMKENQINQIISYNKTLDKIKWIERIY